MKTQTFKEKWTYILSLLIVAGCMFPPLQTCWDACIVPKWYAGMAAVLVCCLIFQRKAIRKATATEWLSCFAGASAIGIGFQAVYTLAQWQHQNAAGIAGTFDAPAGLAMTVCLAVAVIAVHMKQGSLSRIHAICYATAILAGIALIILSQSRAGVLALSLVGVILLLYSRMKKWLKLGIIFALTTGTLTHVFTTKKDSSNGRTFIMEQTIRLIQEEPLTGHGFHGFSKAYMPMQQRYFETHPEADTAWLADEIKHPLNEFLQVWVNYGVLGVMLLLALLILPIVAFPTHPLAWMNSGVLLVFCVLSYPLNYPLAWVYLAGGAGIAIYKRMPELLPHLFRAATIIIGLCILIALPCDFMLSKAYDYSQRGGHTHALATYKECQRLFALFPFSVVCHFRSPQFLYNYTHELYIMGHLDEARQMAEECSHYANGYNLQLLTGDICQMQRDFGEAIIHYRNAHNMCPVRFAPLSGMLQTFQQTGDTLEADSIAHVILTKPVKVPSASINAIKKEAEEWMKTPD